LKTRLALRLGAGMMMVQALFVPAFAQKAEEPYGTFISSTFAHYRMELPKLAWLVPPRTIIATEKTPAIWIWGESEHLTRADYRGKLTPAELRRFRQTEGIACARAAEHDRYELSKAVVNTGGDSSDEQHGDAVFYTTRSGVRIISDATMTDTSDDELSRAGRLFGIIDRTTSPSTRCAKEARCRSTTSRWKTTSAFSTWSVFHTFPTRCSWKIAARMTRTLFPSLLFHLKRPTANTAFTNRSMDATISLRHSL